MQSSPRFGTLATQFGTYIEELHTFLSSCGVSFGAPKDILPFADRLSTPGYLRDGMSAMVRSVIYREQERISQVDLLELVMVAVGGTDVDEDAPEFQQAERKVSRVIGQAMASLWNMPRMSLQPLGDENGQPEARNPDHLPQTEPSAHRIAAPPAAQVIPIRPNGSSELAQTPEPAPMPGAPAESPGPPGVWTAVAHAAALEPVAHAAALEPVAEPEAFAPPASIAARLEPMHPPESRPRPRAHPRPRIAPLDIAAPPRLLWVAGLCALLLAPVLDRIVHHRHRASASPPAAATRHYRPQPVSLPVPAPLPPLDQSLTSLSPPDLDAGLSEHHGRHAGRRGTAHGARTPGDAAEPPHGSAASAASARAVDLPSSVRTSLPTTNPGGSGSQSPPAPQP